MNTKRGVVLVAGGAGYVGSHVCKTLAESGYLPVTLDDLSTGHRAAVRYGPFVKGDIASAAAVARATAGRDVCGAMHFAAKSQVGASMTDPLHYYGENLSKGVAFLQNLQAAGVHRILFSSTAAVYGEPIGEAPLSETAPTAPVNPYGATKLAFEEALRWTGQAGGLSYAVLRYFNAAGADPDGEIGERHDPETHLIPLAIGAALGTRPPLKIFGADYATPDGTALRDYIHVTDLAAAHLAVFERMIGGVRAQLFNAGGGRGRSVMEVIEAVERGLGRPVPRALAPRRAGDPPRLVADISKLLEIGWTPGHSSLETIVRTADAWERGLADLG